jgi:hypothetical protein
MRVYDSGIWILFLAVSCWAIAAYDAGALEIALPKSDLTRSDLPFIFVARMA